MGLRPEYEDAFNSYKIPGLVTNYQGVSFSFFCRENGHDSNYLATEVIGSALCIWVTGKRPGSGESGMGSHKPKRVPS